MGRSQPKRSRPATRRNYENQRGKHSNSQSAAVAACSVLASALALAQGVKIGVLADQSGTYADFDGKWSVEAAKMAVEDFGGSVLGEKIELIDADHQNKVDFATAIARLGMTSKAST